MILSKNQKANNKGANVQAGLHLCCLQTPEFRFSRVEAHLKHICISNKYPYLRCSRIYDPDLS